MFVSASVGKGLFDKGRNSLKSVLGVEFFTAMSTPVDDVKFNFPANTQVGAPEFV